jgi:anti-sigma B factor antagonist
MLSELQRTFRSSLENNNLLLTMIYPEVNIIASHIISTGETMKIEYSELDNNIRLIKLTGALDVIGTGEIETKFAGYCSGDNVRVVVDLSAVDFLASIGIRLLTLTAKSVVHRGGRMVLLNPTPEVQRVLEITGIPAMIPVYSHLESAETVLLAA